MLQFQHIQVCASLLTVMTDWDTELDVIQVITCLRMSKHEVKMFFSQFIQIGLLPPFPKAAVNMFVSTMGHMLVI